MDKNKSRKDKLTSFFFLGLEYHSLISIMISLSYYTNTFPILLLCLLITRPAAGEMHLRQIHVVSRQGSTITLRDGNQNVPTEVLSAVGSEQMNHLGEWLRQKFHPSTAEDEETNDLSFAPPIGLVDAYVPSRVRIKSSATHSTIVAAQTLASALFPSASGNIPVYTQAERNDMTISAGEQCPAFQKELDDLNRNPDTDWHKMEEAYINLLTQLGQIKILSDFAHSTGEDKWIPLENVAKVYDFLREAKQTCDNGFDTSNLANCNRLPYPNAAALLDNVQWDNLKTLARYAEVQSKYGTERAGSLLASNLVRQIAGRMVDDRVTSPVDEASKRVFITSADFPTIIALMTALQVVPDESIQEEAFPGYGSALIFELYQDDDASDGNHAVRVLYKKAGSAKASVLRLGEYCHEKDLCNMKDFSALLDSVMLSTSDWCQQCGNDISDMCMFYSRLTPQSDSQHRIPNNMDQGGTDKFSGVFLGGILLGVLLALLGVCIARRLRKKKSGNMKRRNSLVVDSNVTKSKSRPTTPKTSQAITPSPKSFFPTYWASMAEESDSGSFHRTNSDKNLEMVESDSLVDESSVNEDGEEEEEEEAFDVAFLARSPVRERKRDMHRRTLSVPTPTKMYLPDVV